MIRLWLDCEQSCLFILKMSEMKKLLPFILLVGTCLLIGGCPYETDVPIDIPSVKIDSNLFGTWVDKENENETYTVTRHDDFSYHIVVTQVDDNDTESYLAYVSMVNKTMFLNISKIEPIDTSPGFILYKMETKNDQEVILTEVTENIDEIFSSSQELKKYISKNMTNTYFYGKEETHLVRPGK